MIKVIEIKPSKNEAYEMVNFETVLDEFDSLAGRKPVRHMTAMNADNHTFKVGQIIKGRTIKVNSSNVPYYDGQEVTRISTDGEPVYLQSEIVKI